MCVGSCTCTNLVTHVRSVRGVPGRDTDTLPEPCSSFVTSPLLTASWCGMRDSSLPTPCSNGSYQCAIVHHAPGTLSATSHTLHPSTSSVCRPRLF